MNKNVRDALVKDYEPFIPGLTLPDENDRHVLAAAIKGNAQVIVTYNLKDFPEETLKPYGIQAQHPDEFITHLIDLDFYRVCRAVRQHRAAFQNPPKSREEYLEMIEKKGLVSTASLLREMTEPI